IYYASPLRLEAWIPQRFSCFNQLAHGSAKSHSPGPDTGIVSGLFFIYMISKGNLTIFLMQ
ncbi:MAG: hypothetical protein ACRC9E_17495, partial [Plesiomonas shigelloides]